MKGQTSVEWLFIAAIVLTVATLTLVSYSGESTDTIVETTIRTQVDLAIAKGAITVPSCANMKLNYIEESTTASYIIHVIQPVGCSWSDVFTDPVKSQISGRIAEALGCRYTEPGTCKGKEYNIAITES